jgi:segregation and condensation protein B
MSLKAKLEAVIYAAEEPVTLAQLAALFAADAFEWKAEQETARAEQTAAEAGAPADTTETLPFLNEVPSAVELGVETLPAAESADEAPAPAEEVDAATSEVPATEEAAALETGGAEPLAPGAEPGESDLKREARQRDREVRAILRQILDEIVAECAADGRGVEVREIAGGYRMGTKPECHDAVRLFVKSLKPPLKLSLPALETLAVIAYKQPVTAPEVNEIRGVDSSGVFGSLLARKLIATAGRKQVIGRPILYKTTKEFLLRFGLKDVAELPSMEEFEKMAAIELEEPEEAGPDGAITEIGEPEPIAPEDSAESIAEDLTEELEEAAALSETSIEPPIETSTEISAEATVGPTREQTPEPSAEEEHSAVHTASNPSNGEE